jgi:hypothetical protein
MNDMNGTAADAIGRRPVADQSRRGRLLWRKPSWGDPWAGADDQSPEGKACHKGLEGLDGVNDAAMGDRCGDEEEERMQLSPGVATLGSAAGTFASRGEFVCGFVSKPHVGLDELLDAAPKVANRDQRRSAFMQRRRAGCIENASIAGSRQKSTD